MIKLKTETSDFYQGLRRLGFERSDDALFLINNNQQFSDPQINFHIEKAQDFGATAVFLRKQLNGSFKPQVYIYDFTGRDFVENELTEIQKKIWSSGESPLACIFYKTEIKILNCTTHITDDYKPVYLIKDLRITGEAHFLYNSQFSVKLKSGLFWDEEDNKSLFRFQNSSYDKLIENIKSIVYTLKKKYTKIADDLINKIIVQSILIKYL